MARRSIRELGGSCIKVIMSIISAEGNSGGIIEDEREESDKGGQLQHARSHDPNRMALD